MSGAERHRRDNHRHPIRQARATRRARRQERELKRRARDLMVGLDDLYGVGR